MPQTILLVDDDEQICELLSQFLQKHQFEVIVAHDGTEMDAALARKVPDLVILDIMLPGDDGLVLCRRLREQYNMPVLFLSAMGDDTDRIVGLELGADDYIAKPFNPRELLARLKAILRRSQQSRMSTSKTMQETIGFSFDEWQLLTTTHELMSPEGRSLNISSGEYMLLYTFVTHPRKVLNRDQIMEITKDRDASPFDRSIDMQVSRLRQKIEDNPKRPKYIKTIRGGGYMFMPTVSPVYA